ncbi:putative ribonucleoside-diphosphate reductase small chain B [Lentinus brumalis]|uniref:Ribonucleoside-diphosphate reductase small chain B n=1 Tax=Lentinus brumalis TaxID=2498619 RepID=A0A371D4H9_9APHY|nr:putative ribonucleoside-diphosphate reductase small chain B [Polyporus brumalis]
MATPAQDDCTSYEPILTAELSRFVLFPLRYPDLWNAYKIAQASFWTPAEIDFSSDIHHWNQMLTDDERSFLSTILAFFAASDGIVVENLAARFCADVQIAEARCFYGYQMMMENIHSETYAILIQELISDADEQGRLFSALETMPSVRAKADWCIRWMSADAPFARRLVAFAIVEGVFFSSSFAAIFWMRSRGLLPGLCMSNELIARDEGMHARFACTLTRHLRNKASHEVVRNMVFEAVLLEHQFFEAALPRGLNGMNVRLMRDYVEYVADFLLVELGFPVMFGKNNPFPFMETSAVGGRANFFERGVTDYIGATV